MQDSISRGSNRGRDDVLTTWDDGELYEAVDLLELAEIPFRVSRDGGAGILYRVTVRRSDYMRAMEVLNGPEWDDDEVLWDDQG